MDNHYYALQKSFSESFKINRFIKASYLEIIKAVAVILLAVSFVSVFVRLFLRLQPLLNVIQTTKDYGADADLIGQFNNNASLYSQFLVSSILLLILALILYIIITSLLDSIIMQSLRGEKWGLSTFLSYAKIYGVIDLIFLIVYSIFLYFATDPLWIVIISAIMLILYLYIISIYNVMINEKLSFKKNLSHGLKGMIKIYYYLIPIMLMIISVIIAYLISILISYLIGQYFLIALTVLMVMIFAWSKNYLYKIMKMYKVLKS